MCELLKGPPSYVYDRGLVYRTDELGEASMRLCDFVAAVKITNRLARQWVAEANEPCGINALKRVKSGREGHA